MGVMKRQVYAAQESSHEEARTLALRYWMGMLRHHPDFNEGITSYLEKRPPHFAPWDPHMPCRSTAASHGMKVTHMALEGRTALVTGAAGGIGSAISRHLALADANVAACDLDGDAAKTGCRRTRRRG